MTRRQSSDIALLISKRLHRQGIALATTEGSLRLHLRNFRPLGQGWGAEVIGRSGRLSSDSLLLFDSLVVFALPTFEFLLFRFVALVGFFFFEFAAGGGDAFVSCLWGGGSFVGGGAAGDEGDGFVEACS